MPRSRPLALLTDIEGRAPLVRLASVRIGLGLIEICVGVDEQQPVTTAVAKCQGGSQNDRAVAAEHDGELAALDDGTDGICQRRRPRAIAWHSKIGVSGSRSPPSRAGCRRSARRA
jgi:hypothetical protein